MDTQQGGDTTHAHGTHGTVQDAYATTHTPDVEIFHASSDSMRETAPPHPVASPVSVSRENMGAGGTHLLSQQNSDPRTSLQPNIPSHSNSVHATLIDTSEYDPKIIDTMYDYFYNAEKTKVIEETVYLKNGEIREISKEVANTPPHFSEFCRKKNIPYRKFKLWLTLYDDLYEAYEDCNEIIKEFIIDNGLVGKYQSNFAIFAATNLTDMKVKTENITKQVNVNTLLDQIEKKNTAEIERSKRQALQSVTNTNPQP